MQSHPSNQTEKKLTPSIQPNRQYGYPYPEIHGWSYPIHPCPQNKHTPSTLISCTILIPNGRCIWRTFSHTKHTLRLQMVKQWASVMYWIGVGLHKVPFQYLLYKRLKPLLNIFVHKYATCLGKKKRFNRAWAVGKCYAFSTIFMFKCFSTEQVSQIHGTRTDNTHLSNIEPV
jgi:hypothetical protein